MTVFIIVFAIGGALFFGLRHWDKQARAQRALLAPPEGGETLGDKIEANLDNLEFAADALLRATRRPKADDGDSGGDGGGDGG
jgi:hypothetical protein